MKRAKLYPNKILRKILFNQNTNQIIIVAIIYFAIKK